jgi:signal transduction histidine kinase
MATTEASQFWLRATVSVSALVPIHFWIIKDSIVSEPPRTFYERLRRILVWLSISLILAAIPFTEFFLPSISSATNRIKGPGYYIFIVTALGLYAYLFVDAFRSIRRLSGASRLELQVWLVGGCTMTTTIVGLMAANAFTHDPRLIRLQPIVVFLFYAGTAYAITTYRILDARQIILVLLEKVLLVLGVAGVAYLLDSLIVTVLADPFAFLVTTAIALWSASALGRWLDRQFHFYPEDIQARQAAFAVAQREPQIADLEKAFKEILSGWGQTDHALILCGSRTLTDRAGNELDSGSPVVRTARQIGWATPERLNRERPTVDRAALQSFLDEHRLGVVVCAEGPALTALVGVGVTASRRPFTYPQVTQLAEMASIIEAAMERAHFSAKAQHTEQLATVGLLGASLAHEIRNPLVTIKTFVQLLPKHHQDAAFRDKFFRLIGDEVSRIDQLTEQLLDLASPRTYEAKLIELHPVLTASLDLVAAKAAHKNVRFLTDFNASPDQAFTDASAAKQVMLNLCFNAIQAAESHDTSDRWVRIATRNTEHGIEMAVADSGQGIAPEIRPKLFQPFQTTKSTGFGLGLAICSDILSNLNASITVDPPVPGSGATFRVTFPCQPQSS